MRNSTLPLHVLWQYLFEFPDREGLGGDDYAIVAAACIQMIALLGKQKQRRRERETTLLSELLSR